VNWAPETDPLIPFNFRASDFQNRRLNKERLLQAFELPVHMDVPLAGMLPRMEDSQGTELFARIAERLLDELRLRVILIGEVETRLDDVLRKLRKRYAGRLGVHVGCDEPLAHLLHAGSDLLLLPGGVESRETTLRRAFRYGCVPVVTGAWGTVKEFEPISGRGNGFLFQEADPESLFAACSKAAAIFRKQRTFKKLVATIMQTSWS
jgi:starch synthase